MHFINVGSPNTIFLDIIYFKVCFLPKVAAPFPVLNYHPSITLFMEELPTLRVMKELPALRVTLFMEELPTLRAITTPVLFFSWKNFLL